MYLPCCPNHGCEMDATDNPRIWICPVSGARFDAEPDQTSSEQMFDKFGNPMTVYKITPLDGDGG